MPHSAQLHPMIRASVRAVAIAALVAASTPSLAQDAVRVPGTAVSFELPTGFSLADRFAGIADASRSASIQVVELPAPVAELQADMVEESLAPRGLQLESRKQVDAAIDEALLVEVLQSAGGQDYRLWILLGGDAARTVMMTARAPEPVDAALADELRDALLSATWAPDTPIDPLEALSFSVTPAGGLEIASAMMGSSLLLTLDGRQTQMEPGEPFLIVAQSIREEGIEDLEAYAEERLRRTEGAVDIEIRERRALTIEARDALELVAEITGENDLRSTVYQLMVRDDVGYVLAQGHVAVGGDAEYLPVFRQIGESLRFK